MIADQNSNNSVEIEDTLAKTKVDQYEKVAHADGGHHSLCLNRLEVHTFENIVSKKYNF